MRFLLIIVGISLALLAFSCTVPPGDGIANGAGTAATRPSPSLQAVDTAVADVHSVVSNPAIVAGASLIPYANLVLGLLGVITGGYATIRHMTNDAAAPPPLPSS